MAQGRKAVESVPVNGPVLWADRLKVASTEEAFLDLMGDRAVSLSTLQRAERSQPIQLDKLELIAAVLGETCEKYVRKSSKIDPRTSCDITGSWVGMYVEPNIDHELVLVESDVKIQQRESLLSINISERGSDGELRSEVIVEGYVYDHLVYILSYIEGWRLPWGMSSTMLKVDVGEEVLRGRSTWYDKDTTQVETSENIFVRKGSHMFDTYVERARARLLNGAST
ncbi:MAG: hypothetical protein AAGG55_06365 [Pseudomonadota bacterium]